MKNNDWLDEWVKSTAIGQGNMRVADWQPFNIWLLEPFVGDFWVDKWLGAIKKINSGKMGLRRLSKTVKPSVWRKELRFLMWSAKIWGYDINQRMEIASFFHQMLCEIFEEDKFGLYSNKPDPKSAYEIMQLPFRQATPELSKELGKLSSSCPAISWSLFTDFYYSNSYDIYGLYDARDFFGKGSALVIKNFGPYVCPELWPESRNYKYNKITVYSIHKKLEGHFDIINHYMGNDNWASKMTHCLAFVDGKEVGSAKELHGIQDYFAELASEQFGRFSDLSFEEVKVKCTETKWYQFKDFFAALGEDWRPPKKALDRFGGKELAKFEFPEYKNEREKTGYFMKIVDPRKELDSKTAQFWRGWRKALR
ncbi:MAG TPA: hypothetical protein VJI13_03450 [Candidatus Norongarragalinales archaeon]|nr:hypothetical protein [Candidatus Norongarragalinales archaeon]